MARSIRIQSAGAYYHCTDVEGWLREDSNGPTIEANEGGIVQIYGEATQTTSSHAATVNTLNGADPAWGPGKGGADYHSASETNSGAPETAEARAPAEWPSEVDPQTGVRTYQAPTENGATYDPVIDEWRKVEESVGYWGVPQTSWHGEKETLRLKRGPGSPADQEVRHTMVRKRTDSLANPKETIYTVEFVIEPNEKLSEERSFSAIASSDPTHQISDVLLRVDIDANTDRSFDPSTHAETIGETDEAGEDEWKSGRGAVLHVNYDRDDSIAESEDKFDAITYDHLQVPIKENWTIGNEKDQMDLAYIEVSGTENLPANTKVYLRSIAKPPGQSGAPVSSPMAEVGAFHLYGMNRKEAVPSFTPLWGGRRSDDAPEDVKFDDKVEITNWVNKNASQYAETRQGASGPYRFAIEGLIYPGMKLGSGDNAEPFDGDIRIAVSIEVGNAQFEDLDVVALGMPKQEYDSEGRAKCLQKEDGSYPSTAVDAVGVPNGKFLPSFPGAEGFGRWSSGGRFGAVFAVTKNTDDGSPGTLRWAMTQNVPRTVIVRLPAGTDGNIELVEPIFIHEPNLSFCGQTATGAGLCVRKYKIATASSLAASKPASRHFIIQHLRARVGQPEVTRGSDSLEIINADHVMVDHCSASWANDEQLSVMDSGRVTVQWCFIAEGLLLGNHDDNPGDADTNKHHGMGTLARGAESFKSRYTFHHNYWACVKERMPRPGYSTDPKATGSGPVIDVRNNVMFNWEGRYPCFTSDNTDQGNIIFKPVDCNFVNNRYSPGDDSEKDNAKWKFMRVQAPLAKGYWSGNKWWDDPVNPQSDRIKFEDGSTAAGYLLNSPIPSETVTTEDSNRAIMAQKIFDNGGASFSRDTADQRVATNDHSRIPVYSQAEVGGWPALPNQAPPQDTDGDGIPDGYETAHQMNPKDAKDANLDPDENGYSNLEEYIHSLFSIP